MKYFEELKQFIDWLFKFCANFDLSWCADDMTAEVIVYTKFLNERQLGILYDNFKNYSCAKVEEKANKICIFFD